MTTDRELLELAAMAAGYRWNKELAEGRAKRGLISLWLTPQNGSLGDTAWNPLKDDGAALRLAVALHMTVRCYMGNTCAQIDTPGEPNAYVDKTNLADPMSATRRAIVCAAAAIGAQKQEGG